MILINVPSNVRERIDRCAAANLERKTSKQPCAGLGIFATGLVPDGGLVCYYAGYVREKSKLTPLEAAYSISESGGDPDKSLVGFMFQPKDQPGGVAQLLNDGCKPFLGDYPTGQSSSVRMKYVADAFATYMERSSAIQNVHIDAENWIGIATREIRPGEELYYSYGERYWMWAMIQDEQLPYLVRANISHVLNTWAPLDDKAAAHDMRLEPKIMAKVLRSLTWE